MRRANYEIVAAESTPGRLVIRDVGPWDQFATVTNCADLVVAELVERGFLTPARDLFYYDSAGDLDEILHDGRQFTGFAYGGSHD